MAERGLILEMPLAPGDWWNARDAEGIGDFDGDGFDDVAIDVILPPSVRSTDPWAMAIIYGQSGLSGRMAVVDAPRWTILRPDERARSTNIHGLGDLNNDGRDDFSFQFEILGPVELPAHDAGYILYGTPGLEGDGSVTQIGVELPGVIIFSSDPAHDTTGFHVVNTGDFNGDGQPDLAVSAPNSDALGRTEPGIVWILFDTAHLPTRLDLIEVGKSVPGILLVGTVLPPDPNVFDPPLPEPEDMRLRSWLGLTLAPGGDFDGDGFSDLLVSGTPGGRRTVYLFRGSANYPPVTDTDEIYHGGGLPRVTTFLGPLRNVVYSQKEQVASAGDIDGDGRSELLLGASRHATGPLDSAIYVVRGSSELPARVDLDQPLGALGVTIEPAPEGFFGTSFGRAVTPARDMNGDGTPDILIGVPQATVNGDEHAGEVLAIYMRPELKSFRVSDGFSGLHLLGEGRHAGLGYQVSPAGDFNGDGLADVMAMAPGLSPQAPGFGRVCIAFGGDRALAPLQVFSISPSFGSLLGGTEVLVHGDGFRAGTGVSFGAIATQSVEVLSGTTLRVVVPPSGSLETVDVIVSVGQASVRVPDAFEYTPDFVPIDLEHLDSRGLVAQASPDVRPGGGLALGDLTGDGVADLVAASGRGDAWFVTIVHGGERLPGPLPLETPAARVAVISRSEPASFPGASVALIGDVNGDGLGDLAIGTDERVGYLLFGRSSLEGALDIDREVEAGRAARLERVGVEVRLDFAALGDQTGDGLDDFAVGCASSPLSPEDPAPQAGEVLLVHGRKVWPRDVELGAKASFHARLHGHAQGDRIGREVASAGDVNRDGLTDVLISGRETWDFSTAYLLHGSTSWPSQADLDLQARDGRGVILTHVPMLSSTIITLHLVRAGDVDGDGHDDFLVGDAGGGERRQGRTTIVHGAPALPEVVMLDDPSRDESRLTRLFGESPNAQTGPVGPAGDYDGDGFDDILIASHAPDPGTPGRLSLVFGGPGLPARVDLARPGRWAQRIELTKPFASAPMARESADFDGDASPDFAFSEWVRGGAVYVIRGLAASFLRGDADGDGAINITDPLTILRRLFQGGPPLACPDAGDGNDDGVMNIADAVHLLLHLFRGGAPPPAPFPDVGPDPTADDLDC